MYCHGGIIDGKSQYIPFGPACDAPYCSPEEYSYAPYCICVSPTPTLVMSDYDFDRDVDFVDQEKLLPQSSSINSFNLLIREFGRQY
jgi:hypothetical protein